MTYKDFCNLSEERRRGIDPAQFMLQDFNRLGQEQMAQQNYGNKARSPSQREIQRIKAKQNSALGSEDMSLASKHQNQY